MNASCCFVFELSLQVISVDSNIFFCSNNIALKSQKTVGAFCVLLPPICDAYNEILEVSISDLFKKNVQKTSSYFFRYIFISKIYIIFEWTPNFEGILKKSSKRSNFI